MSDKSEFSDIKPAKQTHKLLFCSNCGEKQLKTGQRHCSNCGESFYPEHSHASSNKDNEEELDRYLAKIGGWLILPYIGFYLGGLLALAEMAVIPFQSDTSSAKKGFLEVLFICIVSTAIACIVQIHKRSKALISTVTILYILGFILSVDSGIKTHSPITPITDAIAAGLWILYFHKSKRVAALLSSKTPKSRSNKASSNNTLAVVLSVVAIAVIGLVVGVAAYASHQSKASQNKLLSLNSQLQSDYNQFASLPSSTTQTESQWNTYYSGYVNEIQTISAATNASYGSQTLSSFNSELQKASSDFLNLVNLDKSTTDMSFQVQDDQNNVNSDKSTIQEYEGDDTVDGEDLMQGEIASEESSLSSDQTTLQNDQQTYSNQQSQASSLDKTVLADLSQLSFAAKNL